MEPSDSGGGKAVLGTEMPDGVRFIGKMPGAEAGWTTQDHPSDSDLSTCVACGLCLPHCPTYRLTGEESASPRGRINAMRAVAEGTGSVDETFAEFMDLCLVCRACEDVCPSHVPFGRMMEHARVQIEPLRPTGSRFLRWLGLDVVLPHPFFLRAAGLLQPLARPFLPRRVREMVPARAHPFARLPATSEPEGEPRGTVALLAGCVQDRWFHDVNLATIRVLTRNGWRVTVPRAQRCCGALAAHNGRLAGARRLATRNISAFEGAERVVVNAAGCSAHMKGQGDLLAEAQPLAEASRDLMEFLAEEGIEPPDIGLGPVRVAYHDACHALRAQNISAAPRELLRQFPELELVEIRDGDRCCGAAGLYNVLEPEMSGELRDQKAAAVSETGATIVASANPGCTMQIISGLRTSGSAIEVLHPVQLLDRAYRATGTSGNP